jgi:hypothetical protein
MPSFSIKVNRTYFNKDKNDNIKGTLPNNITNVVRKKVYSNI